MKSKFFKRLKSFVKRNAYAITVSFCMIFALTVVFAIAIAQLDKKKALPIDIIEETNKEEETGTVPVVTKPVVFVSPVESATEGLPYAENYLVYFKTLNKWQTHLGVDFVAMAGTKVVAAYDGIIHSIDTTTMEGTIIVITHGDNLKTVYKSLSSDVTVSVGDTVKAGDQIGYVSVTAKAEEDLGPHLHFEVLLNEKNVDPSKYLPSADK